MYNNFFGIVFSVILHLFSSTFDKVNSLYNLFYLFPQPDIIMLGQFYIKKISFRFGFEK
jgi:hypothetical protein